MTGYSEKAPGHVAILGLGPSLAAYVDRVKRLGGKAAFCDEVWGINAVGGVLQCDRIFHMDDVEVQERRAEAQPRSNIAYMVEWLRDHPGPVYTSRKVQGYRGLVEYPLEDVINDIGRLYMNNTAAHAVAYALWLGVKRISLFGIDFSYPNYHHAEAGRGCVEFLLGIAQARGVEVWLPDSTALLDACLGDPPQPYGYDAHEIGVEVKNGRGHVIKTPKELPTAEEIEARYDHSKHPNPLMSEGTK